MGTREASVRAVVPCRTVTPSVLRCVREALSSATVGSVLVTVNGPEPTQEDHRAISDLDSRVTIGAHGTNIGLYRNFRSGIDARWRFTKFFAEDDRSPNGLIDRLVSAAQPGDALILPRFARQEWRAGEFFGPVLEHSNQFVLPPNPKVDPSYVFGLWSTDFLLRHWPERPFDWLDYTLVIRAGLERRVRRTEDGPIVLGFTPAKVPHAVSGGSHSSVRAALVFTSMGATALRSTRTEGLRVLQFGLGFWRAGCGINQKFGLPETWYCKVRRHVQRARSLVGAIRRGARARILGDAAP